MKMLNGSELAGFMKEAQATRVRSLVGRGITPKLVIIRDSDNPVIVKYVNLKQQYGEDIGVMVEDWCGKNVAELIERANADTTVHGLIVQLPITTDNLDELLPRIAPAKDVDGLNPDGEVFESATATAINYLLAGYNVELTGKRIALVGHGRLVGAPLEKMWRNSGLDVTVFNSKSDLTELANYNVVVSATGVPHLIKSPMIMGGAIVVDAGTASEGGVLVGDLDDEVRERTDLTALTPKIGGVGPLTVTALFEHVLIAAENAAS